MYRCDANGLSPATESATGDKPSIAGLLDRSGLRMRMPVLGYAFLLKSAAQFVPSQYVPIFASFTPFAVATTDLPQ